MSSQGFDYLFMFFFACVFVVFSAHDSVTAVPGHTGFIVHGKKENLEWITKDITIEW